MLFSVIHLWYKVDRIRGHWAQEIQYFKFGTQLRLDEYYAKNHKTFRTKFSSVWAWEHLKNFGIPYLFWQLLKLAT